MCPTSTRRAPRCISLSSRRIPGRPAGLPRSGPRATPSSTRAARSAITMGLAPITGTGMPRRSARSAWRYCVPSRTGSTRPGSSTPAFSSPTFPRNDIRVWERIRRSRGSGPQMKTRTFTAIVNPTAGDAGSARGGAAALLPVARRLRDAGADVTVEYSRGLEHAATLARAAAGRGDVVLGVGGDGMTGCVGGAVAGTDGILGIVPAGRGNDFARQLGFETGRGRDRDPEELATLLLDGEPRTVDAIEVTGAELTGT